MIPVHLIAGARPNFMKVAPLHRALKAGGWADPVLVHTGQHYDAGMSDAFFEDLGLPAPDHALAVGSAGHAEQTARVMTAYDALCDRAPPAATVVVGDVNSTLACALVAAKRGLPVAHLEAGLRARDRTMPEEINRILTDHACDLLWAPSADAVDNLRAEGLPEARIDLVGNVMIDSLVHLLPRIAATALPAALGLDAGGLDAGDLDAGGRYVVATFHRPANVDDPASLERILAELLALSESAPVVFPLHPRTRARLEAAGHLAALADHPRLRLLEPLGYIAFLSLVRQAAAVVTDSGGIQEETSYLGIPCLTVRPNTERPVTLTHGTNRLIAPTAIAEAGRASLETATRRRCAIPLWDGAAAPRAAESLRRFLYIKADASCRW